MLLAYGYRNIRCFVRPSSDLDRLEKAIGQFDVAMNVELVKGDLLSTEDCAKADLLLGHHSSLQRCLRGRGMARRTAVGNIEAVTYSLLPG